MIELTIPGRGTLQIKYLVTDVNGTIAVDGQLIDGVAKQLSSLSDRLHIHMLTADTHDKQINIDKLLKLKAIRIEKGKESEQKAAFIRKLGAENVIAFGQGSNDAGMLKEAAIGVALLSLEGLAVETLQAADLLLPDINSALSLLEKPIRLIASLRK